MAFAFSNSMKPKSLCVISQKEFICQSVQTLFQNETEIQVQTIQSAQKVRQALASGYLDIMLMELSHFDTRDILLLRRVRELIPDLPLIVLFDRISRRARQRLTGMNNIVALSLEKHFHELLPVVRKIIRGHTVIQRSSFRQTVQKPATVQLTNGEKLQVLVENLSSNGAQISWRACRDLTGPFKLTLHRPGQTTLSAVAQTVWKRHEAGSNHHPSRIHAGVRLIDRQAS